MYEPQLISVQYSKEDGEVIKSKDLPWPQNYESFNKEIAEQFDLDLEKTKIILQMISEDEDEVNIYSKENFEEFIKNNIIRKFKIFTEEREGLNPSLNKENLKKILEENIIKEEEIDINDIMKDIIDNGELKEKMKEDEIKYSKIFKENLEKSVNGMLQEKLSSFKNKIDLNISNYSAAFHGIQKDAYNSVCNIKDNLNDIKDKADEIHSAIKDLHSSIQNRELFLSSAYNFNRLKEGINNLKFEKPVIETIIDIKDCKFFNVGDIKIRNIGNKIYKNLVLYKDNDNSSKDINFQTNNDNINYCDLTVPGEFQHFEFSTTLKIDYPKQGYTYEMIIYVREKGKLYNISDPLKIIVNVNKGEDPIKQKEKKANQIYEELKDEFQENINLIGRDEIIAQLMKNNLNKEEIKNNLNTKIKEIEDNKIEQKIEEIYKELDFHNIPFDKNEIINIIKDKNFDKENVQDWINEKVTKELYERLKKLDDVEIDGINEAEIKEKIRELKYDFEEIKKAYLKNAGPKPYPEKVNILYQELDDDYNVGGFMDEEAAKAKIMELNCDKEACIKWIENHLLGDN